MNEKLKQILWTNRFNLSKYFGVPYLEPFSCIQKCQIRQTIQAGFKSALPHLQLVNSLKNPQNPEVNTGSWNSSSEAHNRQKSQQCWHIFHRDWSSQLCSQSMAGLISGQWEALQVWTCSLWLPSAPSRVAALCSALHLPVNKVQVASCKSPMLFTFTSE